MSADPADRVLTVPNLLSVLRLAGVPLFLYLALGPQADGLAIVVLMLAGASDYFDGRLARAWNQVSRLGVLLDPLADRLYILATLFALTVRGIVPLWFALALIARDAVLLITVPVLRRLGVGSALPVHFLGKAATANLLYAFPLLLLSDGSATVATVAKVIGWAFATWGIALYWWAGILYLGQTAALRRRLRTVAEAQRHG